MIKNESSQSGLAMVTVLVVVATLIGSIYYMYDRVQFVAKTVENVQNRSKTSYAIKGIVTYARDLLASRACINRTAFTGLANSDCVLTDGGDDGAEANVSLERLVISKNFNNVLCAFYNGQPVNAADPLDNFCNPAHAKALSLSNIEFLVKKNKINSAHPLNVLFDENSDYSLSKSKCIKIIYESQTSALHSALATVTTTATAFDEENCSGNIISRGQSQDIFYPRQINEFSLISNKSLAIGEASYQEDEVQINVISDNQALNFDSPVFINQNLYLPYGSASSKVVFNDNVFFAGELKTLNNKPMPSDFTKDGYLWLSEMSGFKGLRKGLKRIPEEFSLAQMFDSSNTPKNDITLMNTCNQYRQRKFDSAFCEPAVKSKLVIKKDSGASHKYWFGVNKLNEFVFEDVSGPLPSAVAYSGGPPTASYLSLTLASDGTKSYLSPPVSGAQNIRIDMLATNLVRLKSLPCLTLTSPHIKYCYVAKNFLKKVPDLINPALSELTVTVDEGTETNSQDFINSDLKYETKEVVNCRDEPPLPDPLSKKVCDLTTKVYNVISTSQPIPTLAMTVSSKKTSPPAPAISVAVSQLFSLNFEKENFDSNLFEFINSEVNMNLRHNDFCTGKDTSSIRFDLASSTIKNMDSSWRLPNGTQIELTEKESDYLSGDYSYHDKCMSSSVSSTGSASYDADWSAEAFNSWNFNPVDKTNQYRPIPSKDNFLKIFDSIYNEPNKYIINSANHNLFHTYSILDLCIVDSSANQVKGFFSCRHLVIKDRTNDLEMIGTFIVDKLTIGSIAEPKKISWKNIYHPSARDSLFIPGNIKSLKSAANCKVDKDMPKWASAEARCDPSHMASFAAPFSWTTFNPLCVILTGAVSAQCKPEDRAYNFNIIRVFEHYGL